MNGPEHYREAERLIRLYEEGTHEWAIEWGSHALASAQVHATLALAAASIEPVMREAIRPGDSVGQAWAEATR